MRGLGSGWHLGWVGAIAVAMAGAAVAQTPQAPVKPPTAVPAPQQPQAQQPTATKAAPTVTVKNPTLATGPVAKTVTDQSHPVAHPLESADLESFFDGILPLQLERSDIAGASVLVMKDGVVLLEKGYGVADVKTGRPVDPQSTIFRLASISKLFTWVSVMQLVEQGKLDLDTDINHYLDFKIREAFGKPVTLRNLMTHTGGFEETGNEIILVDPKKAISLRDYLIQNQPMRIFPPGEVPAYSNYGVGLASYIVQRTSGVPFEAYVQQHIFGPLKMTHSSFYQPLQQELQKLPSEGYREDTTKPPVGFEIFNPVGAGGISSSAADMGRFGMALLSGGELDGARILKPETLAAMWTPQFQTNLQLPPMCMGFYQDWRNGLKWIGHEGDLIAFHSLFFVEPTKKLVLFVSYNSAGGERKPRPEIINFFSDRYFPDAQMPQPYKNWPKEMREIAGTYQTTRRDDTTKMAIGNLFGQRSVTVDKDGLLHVEGAKDLRGHAVKLQAIGKDLWQAVDDQDRLFAVRANGKVVRIASMFPGVQMERVSWYENANLVMPLAGGSIGVLALVVIATLLRTGRRLFLRKRPRPAPQPGTVWVSWGAKLAAWMWILTLGSIAGFFAIAGDDLLPPTPEWFKWFQLMNGAVLLALVLSLFAVISGIRVWKRDLRWITKVKFTLVGLACLILSIVAIHWHLIGPATRI
jgi:CubicO group peptidase (beta-lactamase class C family)